MPKDARPDLASPVLSTILTRLEPALQTEMTRILGPALVAQVTELRFETAVLLEIASEYHAETEMMFRDEDEDILRSRGTFQWNALNQRIQTLVASLRLKGEEAGLSQHDASVVEYVLVKGQSQQLRAASPSHAHDCPQKLLSILKQIGITFKGGEVGSGELHQIVRELRAAIEEERDALLQDIESLHESLDQERGLRSKVETLATAEAPSLQDLQKVKERLESKWIRAEQSDAIPLHPGSSFQQTHVVLPSPLRDHTFTTTSDVDDEAHALQAELALLDIDPLHCHLSFAADVECEYGIHAHARVENAREETPQLQTTSVNKPRLQPISREPCKGMQIVASTSSRQSSPSLSKGPQRAAPTTPPPRFTRNSALLRPLVVAFAPDILPPSVPPRTKSETPSPPLLPQPPKLRSHGSGRGGADVRTESGVDVGGGAVWGVRRGRKVRVMGFAESVAPPVSPL